MWTYVIRSYRVRWYVFDLNYVGCEQHISAGAIASYHMFDLNYVGCERRPIVTDVLVKESLIWTMWDVNYDSDIRVR